MVSEAIREWRLESTDARLDPKYAALVWVRHGFNLLRRFDYLGLSPADRAALPTLDQLVGFPLRPVGFISNSSFPAAPFRDPVAPDPRM
ncbi:hypothetical protein XPA_007861 [Xanthoria parietina]